MDVLIAEQLVIIKGIHLGYEVQYYDSHRLDKYLNEKGFSAKADFDNNYIVYYSNDNYKENGKTSLVFIHSTHGALEIKCVSKGLE